VLHERGNLAGVPLNSSDNHLPRIASTGITGDLANPRDENPYYVMLPCEVKDFRNFVSGLLGKPQELRGEVEGTFKIGHSEITNIYYLLEQRMAKQNDASLIHFMITVYYDDGQSIVHNNIADFETYHPTTQCHPTAVQISATYLIKFRGHETPEKQEIEITFATQPDYKIRRPSFYRLGPLFEYRIVHTERTWATDIAGLLKNHASTILVKPTGIAKFFRQHCDEIAIFFTEVVFLISIILWAIFAIKMLGTTTVEIASLRQTAIFFVKSIPSFALLALMMMALKTYVERSAFFYYPSTIIFTKHDTDSFVETQKSITWGVIRYAAVWVLTVITSIISNILYSRNWFW